MSSAAGVVTVAIHTVAVYRSAVEIWLAVGVGCLAIIDDLRRRKIANWLPAVALLGGVLLKSIESGWRGTVSAVLGAVAGGAAFLVFYLLGGMGGGDIKLMAGFGALLGPARALEAALWTAACGGLIAAVAVGIAWVRRSPKRPESIPYAPAIALGVWLSLVPR